MNNAVVFSFFPSLVRPHLHTKKTALLTSVCGTQVWIDAIGDDTDVGCGMRMTDVRAGRGVRRHPANPRATGHTTCSAPWPGHGPTRCHDARGCSLDLFAILIVLNDGSVELCRTVAYRQVQRCGIQSSELFAEHLSLSAESLALPAAVNASVFRFPHFPPRPTIARAGATAAAQHEGHRPGLDGAAGPSR